MYGGGSIHVEFWIGMKPSAARNLDEKIEKLLEDC